MKNHSGTDFIILILIGVLVLIVAIPTGTGRAGRQTAQELAESSKAEQITAQQAYKQRMEGELEELLEAMDGVGKCRVMLTVEDSGTGGMRVVGAVVVSEGGANAVAASNISRAVMSLFQLEAHKITVVKMSVQEDQH